MTMIDSNTKEEILKTSLKLFAREGYEAASVSMIAEAMNMSKGALYKHFKNKRDIFDCIISRMEQNDAEKAQDNNVPEHDLAQSPEEYAKVSLDDVLQFSKEMFRYWCEDEFAMYFRRMLTIEQYRSKEMREFYQQYLVAGPLDYLRDIFAELKIENPRRKAAMCYAPMLMLYALYDAQEEKERVFALADEVLDDIYTKLKNEYENQRRM